MNPLRSILSRLLSRKTAWPRLRGFYAASLLAALAFAVPAGAAGAAVTYTVTNNADSGAGSLRAAVGDAEHVSDSDLERNIVFDPTLDGATITLTSEISYSAPTNTTLLINASNLPHGITVNGGNRARLFYFANGNVELRNLKLTGGSGVGPTNATYNGYGGAIFSLSSPLVLRYCTFSDNTASISGGAISGGRFYAENCTFSGNHAIGGAPPDGGGAINLDAADTCLLVNCTLSGNSAPKGGAIRFSGNNRKLELIHCTVAANFAGGDGAGGIEMAASTNPPTLRLVNTIVAGNRITSSITLRSNADLRLAPGTEFLLDGQNIIQTLPASVGALGYSGHLIPADPRLKPLGNYGGPTQTMALQTSSPAVNAGRAAAFAVGQSPPTRDQRGYPRVQGVWGDIGAFEADLTYGIPTENLITVTNPFDELDPYGTDGDGISLREAIRDVVTGGVIYFSPSVFGNRNGEYGVIELKAEFGPLVLKRDVTIDARPVVGGQHLFGQWIRVLADPGGHRIIEIPLRTPALTRVGLYGLYVGFGRTPMNDTAGGGCVLNYGDLVMNDCAVQAGVSSTHGGGIANYQSLMLDRCYFQNDNANDDPVDLTSAGGGAISNFGRMMVKQCLFYNNHARTGGAIDHRTARGAVPGVDDRLVAIVNHCTFDQNTATTGGGGVYTNVPWQLQHSVFKGNTLVNGGSPVAEDVRTIDTRNSTGNSELSSVGNSYLASPLVNLAGQTFVRPFFNIGDPMLDINDVPIDGSPVFDEDRTSSAPTTDLFGYPIQNGAADAGALEKGSRGFLGRSGLFQVQIASTDPNDPTGAAAVTASVTATGAVTGSVTVAGPSPAPALRAPRGLARTASPPVDGVKTLVLKFKAQIDPATGQTTIVLDDNGVALTLKLTLNGDGTITAKLTGADGRSGESGPTSALPAKGTLNVGPVVGRYSVAIGDLLLAQNLYYGTLTVDKTGKVKFIGTLPDGSKLSFATKLDSDYRFSARVALYKKLGFFSITSKIDPEGLATAGFAFSIVPENNATLFKPFSGGTYAPNANVSLHRYLTPGKGLQVTDSFAQSGGAGVFGHFPTVIGGPNPVSAFQLAINGTASTNVVGLKVKVFAKTGLFTGTEPSPNAATGEKPFRVNGAILQNYAVPGGGFGIGFGNSLDPAVGPSPVYLFTKDLSMP